MSIITYLKETPLPKRIFGYLVLIIGILGFFQNIFMGSIFIAIGLGLITKEGSEINLDNKTYRNMKSLFRLKFGKWIPCPKFDYVSVFKTKEKQTITVVTASTSVTSDIILLNVFYNKNKHITFFKTNDKEEAFRIAEKMRFILEIDVLDATGVEKQWL
ncbi:hypothetical protein NAT51_13190 [Flavobacterium amniphilum]|uniref:hypothetical protein n=1 Tax=Flavobacterium amniphilum TaxID=1834035 RepID=UPI00202AB82D|nr:hypothetical protein [Flavobacterium amniphilum]MCL9806485.1 hypothetical protein [Flavobacterium amniphilum]